MRRKRIYICYKLLFQSKLFKGRKKKDPQEELSYFFNRSGPFQNRIRQIYIFIHNFKHFARSFRMRFKNPFRFKQKPNLNNIQKLIPETEATIPSQFAERAMKKQKRGYANHDSHIKPKSVTNRPHITRKKTCA